jgi:hypothetical protein
LGVKKIKLNLTNDHDRAVYESAKKTAEAVSRWPAWKRGEGVPSCGWYLIDFMHCDICDALAVWKHPDGGYRCERCPRPEKDE